MSLTGSIDVSVAKTVTGKGICIVAASTSIAKTVAVVTFQKYLLGALNIGSVDVFLPAVLALDL
jgi:hypothetical protein